MTGFTPSWLALREDADRKARNSAVLSACARHFMGRSAIRLIDLGAGAGANLRAMAAHLPEKQDWTLVDHDPALLEAARGALRHWADAVQDYGAEMLLEKAGKKCRVQFLQTDLTKNLTVIHDQKPDLVTAAALFDLTSETWLRQFCKTLTERKLPFYTALTYNGREIWLPALPGDEAMLAAFHAHQAGDKGFGPAAGPGAADCLTHLLKASGYHVQRGESDWTLDSADSLLVRALAEGVASACREMGLLEERAIDTWLALSRQRAVRIGHTDIFAAFA